MTRVAMRFRGMWWHRIGRLRRGFVYLVLRVYYRFELKWCLGIDRGNENLDLLWLADIKHTRN